MHMVLLLKGMINDDYYLNTAYVILGASYDISEARPKVGVIDATILNKIGSC